MVAHRLVEAVRADDLAGAWRVVVLGEERRPAYDRVALTSYMDGWDAAKLAMPGADYEGDRRVELRIGDPVVRVDRERRTLVTAAGFVQPYDALLLATGSRPFVPPVKGHDLPGVFVYRTIEDLDAICERASRPGRGRRSAMVVGGGLLGLEAAKALRKMGLSPHVVEMGPRLMPLQIDEGGGGLLRRLITGLDVTVHTGTSTDAIEADGDRLFARLGNGTELDLDLVVFSAAIRPRDDLARESGLDVGQRGGILVDRSCRTSDENIYAIGECAAVEGKVYGIDAPG